VAAQDDHCLIALLAEDGDKYYRAFGKPRRLVHFLARRFPRFDRIWESRTAAHELSGTQEFHHRLVLADGDWRTGDLVGLAERVRHPLRQQWARGDALCQDVGWLRISPATVHLSSLACEGASVLLRMVQMAPRSARVTVTLPFEAKSAEFVDLCGDPLPGEVAFKDATVTFQLAPWRIATLRLREA
jgi:hypothetical protein